LKYSKELEWLRPYIEKARVCVPNIDKLDALYKLPLKKNKRQTIAGVCHEQGGRYKIFLYTEYNSIKKYNPLTLKRKKYSKIDIIEHLAHELSHMVHWDHCPKRLILQSQLAIIFAGMLYFDGYESEEHEFGEKK
jgi:hypothetical protein